MLFAPYVRFHILSDIWVTEWFCLENTSLCIDYPVESCKITVFLFAKGLLKRFK